ncbi:unnamed protein product [Mytilus edulis]|uniref:Uncharacterized protein n=1 Tax=Mytilus edulis TaxID=6550 RepID=A0A8S3RU22_MYTED|nr:unnamed protein product [Mytilus edulis]
MNADQKAASSDCNVSTQNGLGMFQEYLLESNISGELLQGLLTDETYAGPFCNEVGITLKWLENPCEIPIKTEIKKGLILEFRKAKIRFGFSVKQCSQWQTIKNSKERIEFLENENMNLQEEITEFKMSFELNQIVQTFHNGKYNDTVREVYAALLSLNVGVNNVEKVVRTVLEKLGGLKVERLPKRTFSEIMLVEAKALAQMQAAEAMLTSECNTLHTDGTKRGGHEFGGVQVGTSFGQFSLGINEMVRGDAESFKLLIDSVLTDMSKILVKNSDANLCKESRSKLILSIKNMMTDRHIVNQSLKSLLEKMKIECLPTDDDTDMDLIKKMSAINGFKCNLHVLVNFATQAESGLKLWEQNILESVDCSSFFSPSCCDFIRASTKLCVPGADEKSGYGLLFKTFLNQLEPPVDLQLTTFHGHRINLLFSMGASVFHHRNHIKLFIENYFNKEDRNRLLCAVYNYVNNPVYLAGCRALGIVDKLLTGPLWRIIENVDHILDLNDIWLVFKNSIELLSKDASELIEGKVFYPKFYKKDEVFNSLFINNDVNVKFSINFCVNYL